MADDLLVLEQMRVLERINALPDGSVLIDDDGDAWQICVSDFDRRYNREPYVLMVGNVGYSLTEDVPLPLKVCLVKMGTGYVSLPWEMLVAEENPLTMSINGALIAVKSQTIL